MLKFVAIVAGILLVLQNVSAQCDCVCKCGGMFGSAEEVRHHAPLVVRPQPMHRPAVAFPFLGHTPAGPCYKKKAIVKPAVVPKPVYIPTPVPHTPCSGTSTAAVASALAAAASALSSATSSSSISGFTQEIAQNIAAPSVPSGCQPINYEAAYQQYLSGARGASNFNSEISGPAPADAVSLDLAYKRTQRPYKYVSEDKLAFGFRKLPIDELPLPKTSSSQKSSDTRTVIGNVNEENLYSLNGQIVELKPVKESTQGGYTGETLAEEAADELLDLEGEDLAEEAQYAVERRGPSLTELGYAPAEIGQKQFIELPVAPVEAAISAVEGVAGNAVSGLAAGAVESILDKVTHAHASGCSRGFKSGTVEYKTVAKPKYFAIQPPSDHSCESHEEEAPVCHIQVPQPMCSCSCPGNVNSNALFNNYISHQSSSGSSAVQSAAQFVEKSAGKLVGNTASHLLKSFENSKAAHFLENSAAKLVRNAAGHLVQNVENSASNLLHKLHL